MSARMTIEKNTNFNAMSQNDNQKIVSRVHKIPQSINYLFTCNITTLLAVSCKIILLYYSQTGPVTINKYSVDDSNHGKLYQDKCFFWNKRPLEHLEPSNRLHYCPNKNYYLLINVY